MAFIIEETTKLMNTLDAAGYAILVMRCNQDTDIRRVLSGYSYRFVKKKSKALFVGRENDYKKVNCLLEATAMETVRDFDAPFSWGKHGLDENHQLDYGDNPSLMAKLESFCKAPGSMDHVLLYIPNIVSLVGDGMHTGRTLVQKQYISMLQEIARLKRAGKSNALIVIGCTDGILCDELREVSYVIDIPYPSTEELVSLIKSAWEDCDAGQVRLSGSQINSLAEIMRGLREDDVRKIFDMAYASVEYPTNEDAKAIFGAALDAKKQMITGVKGLKWIDNDGSEVGGLHTLREWLEKSKLIFEYPHFAQLQKAVLPKGVLLCGLPGSGKTTLARYTATLLGTKKSPLPLIQMNISDFNDKYIGESEANCEIALRTVESVAPCVLLVDEIEKTFGSVGSGNAHEVTMHIFSSILDWMQKRKEKPVFVIATANKTDSLPPEFKRKGRFDEVFFVGVPCAAECRAIFQIHIDKKSNLISPQQDYKTERDQMLGMVLMAAAKMKRFLNGADIESIVDAAFRNLFVSYVNSLSEKERAEIDERTDADSYEITQVEKALIDVLKTTRSYFDNNMETTARYWLDMFEQQFLEAGGAPKDKSNERWDVLPSDQEAFDKKTRQFSPKWLKDKGYISDSCQGPKQVAEKNNNGQKKSEYELEQEKMENYRNWLYELMEKAAADGDYDGAFRWHLAKVIAELDR